MLHDLVSARRVLAVLSLALLAAPIAARAQGDEEDARPVKRGLFVLQYRASLAQAVERMTSTPGRPGAVLVVRPDGAYYEGYYSFLAHQPDLILDEYPSQRPLLEPLGELAAVQRLRWFTHGFYAVDEVDGKLVMTDLRMGAEPRYAFRFAVASNKGGVPQPIPVEQLPWPDYSMDDLRRMWRLLWQPVTRPLAPGTASASP